MQGSFRQGLVRFDKYSWQLNGFDAVLSFDYRPKKGGPIMDRRLSNF